MASTSPTNQWYQPVAGLNNVGSYQVSSIPWVSSSIAAPSTSSAPTQVSFPTVSKFVTVKNLGSSQMRIGFSDAGIKGSNYFIIAASETVTLDVKVTSLYLSSTNGSATSASLAVGLTGIPASELPSNWSGSSGVG